MRLTLGIHILIFMFFAPVVLADSKSIDTSDVIEKEIETYILSEIKQLEHEIAQEKIDHDGSSRNLSRFDSIAKSALLESKQIRLLGLRNDIHKIGSREKQIVCGSPIARDYESDEQSYCANFLKKVIDIGNRDSNLKNNDSKRTLKINIQLFRDGNCRKTEIYKGSGDSLIDATILGAAKKACPYYEFPKSMYLQYDILSFIKTIQVN